MEFILAGIGGILGSISRAYISDKYNKKNSFPTGTFIVNLLGSILLGFLSYFTINQNIKILLFVGILGSFTTFSTFILEGFSLLKDKKIKLFLTYIISTTTAGIILFYVSFKLSELIF